MKAVFAIDASSANKTKKEKVLRPPKQHHGMPLPQSSARAAGLRFISDGTPGIRRVKKGKTFSYVQANGKTVSKKDRARIDALVLPPAWKDVWICEIQNGHLQATGLDAKGRKQYRYHEKWREVRDAVKFHRMIPFGEALPRIRANVEKDLKKPVHSREAILATVVRLLDITSMRVGNEEYAAENHSYGLTTLQDRHVNVHGSDVHFHFRGKRGIEHTVHLHDKKLAHIIHDCQELPGQELFQYVGKDGKRHNVTSADVNAYIQSIADDAFTAKDFRTWAGTVEAALNLEECDVGKTAAQIKKNIVGAVHAAAEKLGNTPAICRKCYVHPSVIECYEKGDFITCMARSKRHRVHGLTFGEAAVLAFLKELS